MMEFLIQFAVQATRIIVPIIIVIGVLSNSLNVIVLSRPALVHHPCSLYFISLAVVNLFYSSVMLAINLRADGYQLDLSLYSVFSCKLISYLFNLCPNLSLYLIVLASIDRYCASSVHARIRSFSSVRVARCAIAVLIFTFVVLMCWTLVAFNLSHNGFLRCGIESEILSNQIFFYIEIAVYVIVAPLCLILFGFLTIKNTNTLHLNRNQISRFRRTERQLSRMLVLQVGTHLILTLPFCITFFMLVLPISLTTTIEFYYTYIVCKLPFYLTFTTAFFLYILSGQVYRSEFIRLFRRVLPIHRVHPIHITANNIAPMNLALRER